MRIETEECTGMAALENCVAACASGSTRPQSCHLAEPLWTNAGLKNRTAVRELVSLYF